MSTNRSRTGITRRRYAKAWLRRLARRATYGDLIVLEKPVLWALRSEDTKPNYDDGVVQYWRPSEDSGTAAPGSTNRNNPAD